MSSSGSGTRTIVSNAQDPPQLAAEAREGYKASQKFFKDQLANPAQYTGDRLAPVEPAQTEAIAQQKAIFGDPTTYLANRDNLTGTLSGQYLDSPEMQNAIRSAADPLMRNFASEVAPALRDSRQFSRQGLTSTRSDVATEEATRDLGDQIGRSVIAPLFSSERDRMLQASAQVPQMYTGEGIRTAGLAGAGAQERGFEQEYLDVLREIFEEPLFRQSEAASALMGGSVWGPGSSVSGSRSRQTLSTMDEISRWLGMTQQLMQIGGAVAMMAGCTKDWKEDIAPLGEEMFDMMADSMLNLEIKTWRYKWEPSKNMRMGPILEESPQFIRDPSRPDQYVDLLGFVSSTLVTVQQVNKRLTRRIEILEEKIRDLQTAQVQS